VLSDDNRSRLCQNVKLPILLEIINRLLLELQSKVEVTINNYPVFLQVNGVNFISEDFLCDLTQPRPEAPVEHTRRVGG